MVGKELPLVAFPAAKLMLVSKRKRVLERAMEVESKR
jgi:hypothetical protein